MLKWYYHVEDYLLCAFEWFFRYVYLWLAMALMFMVNAAIRWGDPWAGLWQFCLIYFVATIIVYILMLRRTRTLSEALYCEGCDLLLTPDDKRCPRCGLCPTC